MRPNDFYALVTDLAEFETDPLGFVMWAFPWGEKGSPLDKEPGPEDWQREQLERIGRKLRNGGDAGAVIQEDTKAGHGSGKSALVAWLILWAISTMEQTRGVVTANTEGQLKTKTWPELGKWHAMFIAKDLFEFTATAIYAKETGSDKTWRIDQVPWSREKPESFAGLHNKGKRILVIFDEASAIDDLIWEVTEGAMTDKDTQIIWCRYGNPTRTVGEFHRRCTRPIHNHVTTVDSGSVRLSNKVQIHAWIDEYGEDSDFVRVRVKGEFPRAGMTNFIPFGVAEDARKRVVGIGEYDGRPLTMSVDPARFGDDFSVITLRQGRKVHWQHDYSGFDGPDLAGKVLEAVKEHPQIKCIAYDAIGIGADLDSSLRRTPGLPNLMPITWGVPAEDDKKYANQRAEAWGCMRDWMVHGEIPDDDALCIELTSLDYGYDRMMRIQLQSKKDIKRNGGKSPDRADSLALSFLPYLASVKSHATRAKPVWAKSAAGWT